jgi:outer membrane biosynthesis protein TonB
MSARHRQDTALSGFGTDVIRLDFPFGGAASLVIHGGLIFATMFAWQVAPRIMPEDVISVEVVSDTPSVLGENAAPETAQVGVDTPNPSPLPQPLESSPAPASPQPETLPPPSQIAPAIPLPPPPPSQPVAAPLPTPPPPPLPTPAARATPNPRPLPQTPTRPPPPPPSAVVKAPVPQRAPAPARPGRAREAASTPTEFDLSAASAAASGADSGGRRSPELASRGSAGRVGRAGGGAALTGDLEAALRAQLKECWAEPADLSNPASLIVDVSIELGIDGRLRGAPVLVRPTSRAGASNSLNVAIDNALRAVNQCAPFTLPPDRHDQWRQVRFSFDPRRMARP